MHILFQHGIPDLFLPDLVRRGWRVTRFPTDIDAAIKLIRYQADDVEAIFFRANCIVNKTFLDAMPALRLAALVSTGADNVDIAELERRKIRLVSGEGANAQAVFDYVIQALIFGDFDFSSQTIGIVGAGRIGSRILGFLQSAGVGTAHFDPFLLDAGSLEDVLACDIISFHVPLTREHQHATVGMLNDRYFSHIVNNIQVIQSCRGGIWQEDFYQNLHNHPKIKILAQDVYPGEPPGAGDLARARFSTPHIAGYSTQGRLGGIIRGMRALIPDFDPTPYLPQSRAWFLDDDDRLFRASPADFNRLRDSYFWRKEFHEYDAAEQIAFRARFPRLSDQFTEKLFSFNGTFPQSDQQRSL